MAKSKQVHLVNALNGYRNYQPSPDKIARLTLEEAVCNHVPIVYFIRRPNGIVKIGHTRDLISRLRKLNATAEDVLCIMRGGRAEESVIHFTFRSSRVALPEYEHGATEHFRMTTALKDLINSLRAEMRLAPLT